MLRERSGSGSIPLTNGSAKNMWIRIRIRICNTATNPPVTLLLTGHLDGGVEKADGQEAAVPAGGQAGDALVQLEGPPVH